MPVCACKLDFLDFTLINSTLLLFNNFLSSTGSTPLLFPLFLMFKIMNEKGQITYNVQLEAEVRLARLADAVVFQAAGLL